jgi:serine/threonine-protein kinase
MVHRDIKPENIVLVQTEEGEKAKVLDFGIARVKEAGRGEEAKGMDLTGGGFVVGTPLYISPEQAQGKRGDDLDGRSDLYSLGIVMYQMLTGTVPFKSDVTMDLLIAHIQKPPTPIRLVRPDLQIPEALANLVMRMLQKKRDLRPPSATACGDGPAGGGATYSPQTYRGDPCLTTCRRSRCGPAPARGSPPTLRGETRRTPALSPP